MCYHLWQDVLLVELHGDKAIEDLLETDVCDVVEGLNVVLGCQSQIKGLLILHFI